MTTLNLVPVKQLQHAGGCTRAWRATGSNPQFCCEVPLQVGWAAGWYWIDIRLKRHSGAPKGAALYPDFGDGCWQSNRISLANLHCVRTGRIAGVVLFEQDLKQLRFGPFYGPGDFVIEKASLTRLPRYQAFWKILVWNKGRRSLGHAFRRLIGALRSWRRAGLRSATGQLLKRHHGQPPPATDERYAEWTKRYDDLGVYSGFEQGLARPPVLSILLPTFNTPEILLRECIESVLAQSYPHWELCIADDASTDRRTRALLERLDRDDPRIRIAWRDSNGHISVATNSALSMASGEFCVLLDHDDQFHPDALREIAGASIAHPEWHLIYSDEDKLDMSGARCSPYFKPDFNPALLLGQNCISHLGAYRTRILCDLGGFRPGYEGCQDWDLALRFSEHVGASAVGHIPRILYHWRMSQSSTAADAAIKPYVRDAALKTISDHLARVAERGGCYEVCARRGTFRVRYALPAQPVRVSCMVRFSGDVHRLARCITSVCRTGRQSHDLEFVVYDIALENGSALKALLPPDCVNTPIAYVASDSCNGAVVGTRGAAVDVASGDVLIFLDDCVEAIESGWLDELAAHALRVSVGAVGAKLYSTDGRIANAGMMIAAGAGIYAAYNGWPANSDGMMSRARLTQDASAVSSACMAIRRELFVGVDKGVLSPNQLQADIDLCCRLRKAGYRIVWTPFAELLMHGAASARGYESAGFPFGRTSRPRLVTSEGITPDPAYNENLCTEPPLFRLAFPPRRRKANWPVDDGLIATHRAL